ncbi:DNA/RNA nuclease SfsA, partial [Enterococcus faecalis]|uniref:DNA/RNA nuclease SfsA n=1 Tax=Enterococcus faecalis TaxID=1351 RepID=UPI003CC5D73B
REQGFGHSKFDFLVETESDVHAFVEVKRMTLENKGIGAFPDAPSLRGLKQVTEQMAATKAGYRCFILFVVQFEEIKQPTIH